MRPGAVLGEEMLGESKVDSFEEVEYLDEEDQVRVVANLAGLDEAIERANRVCDKIFPLLEIHEKPESA